MHTVLHTGCQAAKGVTGTPGTDDHLVLDAIWENAFDRNTKTQPIRRTSDQKLLSYYGFFDANGNNEYDAGEGRNDTDVVDAAGLIATGNGQCHSWAEFLYEVMKAQGLKTINTNETTRVSVEITPPNLQFAIKHWAKTGDSPRLIVDDDAGVDGGMATLPDPAGQEVCDAKGADGQGNSPNPPAHFLNHWMIKIHNQYYDPSYGLGPYTDLKAYEDEAFEGSIYLDSGLYYIRDLPVNNGDATDHSDEINTYIDEVFP